MKIEFSNLGAIKHTELDLRPLTIIIGNNNSNKTYVAYSVYGLFDASKRWMLSYYGNGENCKGVTFTQERDILRITLDSAFYQMLRGYCQYFTEEFRKDLPSFFQDAVTKVFQETQYNISGFENEVKRVLSELSGQLRYIDGFPYNIEIQETTLIAQHQTLQNEGLDWTPMADVMEIITRPLFGEPFILPAERNSLILTYRLYRDSRERIWRDAFAKNERRTELYGDALRRRGAGILPRPLEDFLDELIQVERWGGQVYEPDPYLPEYASLIEQHIQNGNKTQYRQAGHGGREIVVQVNKDVTIGLPLASSSIKQLAPLLSYLRYRANKNDLLVIDEPEMNLHPESQVKLLEVLAMVVNAGVKVLLTTHSPYFLAHLNNLVQDEEKPTNIRKKQATSLYLKDPRAFLNMEQVSAYEMQDRGKEGYQLVSLKDPAFGIRWDTLSDVSIDINNKYFEIYEKGKGSKRARKSQTTSR